jgi:hypothetical protein
MGRGGGGGSNWPARASTIWRRRDRKFGVRHHPCNGPPQSALGAFQFRNSIIPIKDRKSGSSRSVHLHHGSDSTGSCSGRRFLRFDSNLSAPKHYIATTHGDYFQNGAYFPSCRSSRPKFSSPNFGCAAMTKFCASPFPSAILSLELGSVPSAYFYACFLFFRRQISPPRKFNFSTAAQIFRMALYLHQFSKMILL